MAILFLLKHLKTKPYNHPHYTRDELLVYILPHSYVLPVAASGEYSTPNHMFVNIGALPFRETKQPWKTSGKYVYLMPRQLTDSLQSHEDYQITDDKLKSFLNSNSYVTGRLYFIEFEKAVEEKTNNDISDVVGFIVKMKNLKITTPSEEIGMDLSPVPDGDWPI